MSSNQNWKFEFSVKNLVKMKGVLHYLSFRKQSLTNFFIIFCGSKIRNILFLVKKISSN